MPVLLPENRNSRRINAALNFAHANFHANLNLDSLADVACLSKYHFLRLFHDQVGESPIGFLKRIRLERSACLLIYAHNRPILDVALNCGSQANIRNGRARRAGMAVSGVSRNNRVVERHPARNGGYWKSFDFATSSGRENIFRHPVSFEESGGEMVFALPNGMHGYYVCDHIGHRIPEAPTSIVTDIFAADATVRNGLACMRCHQKGVRRFRDDVDRPSLRFRQLPEPTSTASASHDFTVRARTWMPCSIAMSSVSCERWRTCWGIGRSTNR